MLELLEKLAGWVGHVWRRSRTLAILVAILLCLSVAEAAQSGFLGTNAFRIAARFLPWQPLLASRHTTTAIFMIETPGKATYEVMVQGQQCPVGSNIQIQYKRSAAGWISLVGFNKSGLYPILVNGAEVFEVAEGEEQNSGINMTTSDGEEMFLVVGSDKPFAVMRDFKPAFEQAKAASSKGGEPDLAESISGGFDVAPVARCVS